MSGDFQDRVAEFVARHDDGVVHKLARRCQVAPYVIYRWIHGASVPNDAVRTFILKEIAALEVEEWV